MHLDFQVGAMEQQASQSIDIITLETFAERMGVSPTTVHKWIRIGRLKPGRHFIQIDRVIRFSWGPELIQRLHEDCLVRREDTVAEQTQETRTERNHARRTESPLNLTY